MQEAAAAVDHLYERYLDDVFTYVLYRVPDRSAAEDITAETFAAALEIATRGYVIETGQVKLQGTAEELRSDPKIRSAYLGL